MFFFSWLLIFVLHLPLTMLQKLHIQNYAIIEELSIAFSPNLNIITGETGAGKSILMGALNLILGQRADSNVLQNKEQKCIVEAVFALAPTTALKNFFSENDLDISEEILVRREIAVNGKSRGFINDTPVNLSQLKALSILLVDLHQQFDTLELGNENFQREVLDALANNAAYLSQLKEKYQQYTTSKNQLENMQLQQANANKELDYNRFLFDELEELSLKKNELEELNAELKLLNNSESVKQQLGSVSFELKDSEQPLVQQLKILQQRLAGLQQYHPQIQQLTDRVNSAAIELQDVADELEQIDNSINFDAERIQVANERLSAGYKLLKKHGATDTQQLLDIQQVLQQKLDAVLNISNSIEKLEKETALLYDESSAIAAIISANRSAQIKSFTDKVNKLLVQVGMPNAQIKVQLQPAGLSASGIDEILFLFDANKSNRFEPLQKVASGGELSRLMLSIKSLVAKKLQLPTLIFDEIDTGISGEAARQVGIIMKGLSAGHQLIVISHQPQIAAKASSHYFVYKEIVRDKIVTSIRQLGNDERITAIAKMLSGEKPTAAALENAREMVAN